VTDATDAAVSPGVTCTRSLSWVGCFNVRDLGPLTLAGGRVLRSGAVIRSDSLERLTSDGGWDRLVAYGITTVIDLRNVGEIDDRRLRLPQGVTRVHMPLDAIEDRTFWDYWGRDLRFATPRYYGPHLERFPTRSASVLRMIADAPEGGVLIYCGLGRDRTGLIVMLLLTLLGAASQAIADDYLLSAKHLESFWQQQGLPNQDRAIAEKVDREGATLRQLVYECLASIDVHALLRMGGLSDADLDRLRSRMLVS
jgi:protein-tyrosine phosphatase